MTFLLWNLKYLLFLWVSLDKIWFIRLYSSFWSDNLNYEKHSVLRSIKGWNTKTLLTLMFSYFRLLCISVSPVLCRWWAKYRQAKYAGQSTRVQNMKTLQWNRTLHCPSYFALCTLPACILSTTGKAHVGKRLGGNILVCKVPCVTKMGWEKLLGLKHFLACTNILT